MTQAPRHKFRTFAIARDVLVAEALKGKTICATCGATLETYAEKCKAAIDLPCEGFATIERELNAATAKLRAAN